MRSPVSTRALGRIPPTGNLLCLPSGGSRAEKARVIHTCRARFAEILFYLDCAPRQVFDKPSSITIPTGRAYTTSNSLMSFTAGDNSLFARATTVVQNGAGDE
jgi:hypothetical protein